MTGEVAGPPGQVAGSAARAELGSVPLDVEAYQAVTSLFAAHYRTLVGLAAFLVRDTATAEEVVQDSFVAMHCGWSRLRESDKALPYLRRSVVNRSRSVLRHRMVIDKEKNDGGPDRHRTKRPGCDRKIEALARIEPARRLAFCGG